MNTQDAIKALDKLCVKPQDMAFIAVVTKGFEMLHSALAASQRSDTQSRNENLRMQARIVELEKQLGIYKEPVKQVFGIQYNKSEVGPRQE